MILAAIFYLPPIRKRAEDELSKSTLYK